MGDALGAPVEFMSLAEIRAQFGRAGINEPTTAFDRKGGSAEQARLRTIAALRDKLQRKNEVVAELMEEHIQLEKGLGEL